MDTKSTTLSDLLAQHDVSLAGDDYDPSLQPPLFLSIAGHEKHGKTRAALSIAKGLTDWARSRGRPGVNIGFISLDRPAYDIAAGLGILDRLYARDFTGLVPTVNPTTKGAERNESYAALVASIRQCFVDMLLCPEIGIVIVDNMGGFYDFVRLGELGKLERVQSRDYGPANREMTSFCHEVQQVWADRNLGGPLHRPSCVFLSRLKKEYRGENWLGAYEREGWKNLGNVVLTNMVAERLDPVEREGEEDLGFRLRIVSSGENPTAEGKVMKVAEYPALMRRLYPEWWAEYGKGDGKKGKGKDNGKAKSAAASSADSLDD